MARGSIAIALAPTGGWGRGNDNPTDPAAVAKAAIDGIGEGASVVHMHARDDGGYLIADTAPLNTTVQRIKETTDFVFEASTGGLSRLTAGERAAPVRVPGAEIASLNLGSLNFGDDVYRNSVPDVRFWLGEMQTAGVRPSLEVFDTGHLETARFLIEEGAMSPPFFVNFIFGVRWGMRFESSLLAYLVSRLPDRCAWGATFVGSRSFDSHLEAARAGALVVRTGFEDTTTYDGKTARSNTELVAHLRGRLEGAGFTIADVEEARRRLVP